MQYYLSCCTARITVLHLGDSSEQAVAKVMCGRRPYVCTFVRLYLRRLQGVRRWFQRFPPTHSFLSHCVTMFS